MIVGEPLKSRIERFLRNFSEPYKKVENVSMEKRIYVEKHYIPTIIGLVDDTKMEIMQILEESWDKNQNHGNVKRWGRAARGIVEYLLLPKEMNQVQLDVAADVVVRVSRWYHTNRKCGLWKRFIPYVSNVVELAWGDIEQLYDVP
jgi:hypothetical protein